MASSGGDDEKPRGIGRRRALAALGSFTLAACGSSGSSSRGRGQGGAGGGAGDAAGGQGGTSNEGGSGTCAAIPDETAGPFPDTMGMIGNQAFHRSDITEGKPGTPLTLTLTVVDAADRCTPIANANVEVWHCDAGGVYSEYANVMNPGSTAATYLRGVQTTDGAGQVTFVTIYPGWYTPRATHIHVRVYSGTTLKKTTQLGFPDAVNNAVYSDPTLYAKGSNTTTNDTDQVFGNAAPTGTDGGGHAYQIALVTGDNAGGYTAMLPIGVTGFA